MTTEAEKLTVEDVATSMKTTSMNVLMHIKRGLLAGEEIGGVWYVAADSLAGYLAGTGGAARGSLCKSKRHCGQGCSSSCG